MKPSPTPKGLTLAAALEGHSARIAKPAWSPSGSLLASGSDDGTIRLWTTANWKPMRVLAAGDGVPVGRVAWSPDSNLLAAGAADGCVRIWNVKTGEVEKCLFPSSGKPVNWTSAGSGSYRRPLVRDVS